MTWDVPPEGATAASRFIGAVPALGLTVDAIVDRHDIDSVWTWQTTVPVGIRPMLPATLRVHYTDGVSQDLPVRWDELAQSLLDEPVVIDRLVAYFTVADASRLPAATRVFFWDGARFAPIADFGLSPVGDSGTRAIEFPPVATDAIRLEMESAFPGTESGFIRISELEAYGF